MSDQATQGIFSPFLQRRRIAAALPHITGAVLDFGCGNGGLASVLPSATYWGYDRDPLVVEKARAHFPQHRFATAVPTNMRFDVIVMLAVIEHLEMPTVTLRSLSCHLRVGGTFVLTTPHRSLEGVHEFGATLGLFSSDAAEEHHTLFNEAGLLALAAEAALDVLLVRRFLLGANQLCILRKST